MTSRSEGFLAAVLGADGAAALHKAVAAAPVLERALLPRAALAWVRANPAFQGDVPGGEEYAEFVKTESGFCGAVSHGGEMYRFRDASIFHVAAAVTIALDSDEVVAGQLGALRALRALRARDFGKSLDVLAKVSPPGKYKDLPEKLKAKGYSADKAFAIAWAQHDKEKAEEDPAADADGELKKDGDGIGNGTGTAAAATPPSPPVAPTTKAPPPKPVPTKKPTVPTVKLKRSEVSTPCPACRKPQAVGDVLSGCSCFSELIKSVEVLGVTPAYFTVRFQGWDADALVTFLEAVGRN